MVLRITRAEVLNNLVSFKDNLSELREKQERDREDKEEHKGEKKRKYKVLLNRKTGDMRFIQKISVIEEKIAEREYREESLEDFKEIQIIVNDRSDEAPQFEVLDNEEKSLNPHDIDPIAFRVTSETIELLNKKAEEEVHLPKEFLLEEEVLRDLSSIQVELESEQIQHLPGWVGAIDRIEAEKLLETKEIGTYLLRAGDEITEQSAFHLDKESHLSLHPYILTVVQDQSKISDLLLLQTDKGWTVYHDDPNLNDPEIYQFFPTVKVLIDQMKEIAKNPLTQET